MNPIHTPTDHQLEAAALRIAAAFHVDFHTRQDLEQEIRLHLWLEQIAHPDRTRSWYLQSCLFHVQACLRHGRSFDSPRHSDLHQLDGQTESPDGEAEYFAQEEMVTSTVSARDIVECLLPLLSGFQRDVLSLLNEGYRTRPVAEQLHSSQSSVTRARRAIAEMARRLGVSF